MSTSTPVPTPAPLLDFLIERQEERQRPLAPRPLAPNNSSVKAQVISNNRLSGLKDPFRIVTLFLSQKEIVNLSFVSRDFNNFSIEAIKYRQESRIKNLISTKFFTKIEESTFNLDNSLLLNEQELKLRRPVVKLINRLEAMMLDFMQRKLSLKERENKLISSLREVVREYGQFPDCKINFDLLRDAILSPRPELIIKQVIKKYSKSLSRFQLIEQQFAQKLLLLNHKDSENPSSLFSLQKAMLKEYKFKKGLGFHKSELIEDIQRIIKEYGESPSCKIDLALLKTAIRSDEPLSVVNSVMNKYYKSDQYAKDLNVLFILQSNFDPISIIKKIVNEHGGEYFPLIEHILMIKPYIKIKRDDVKQIISSLVEQDSTEAINFINILIKRFKVNSENLEEVTLQEFKQKLYSMMIYSQEEQLYAMRSHRVLKFARADLLKAISSEFNISVFLSDFFIRAISSDNYESISKILEFIQIKKLDSFSRKALAVQALFLEIATSILSFPRLERLKQIKETIKLMQMIPQKETKTNILNKIVDYLWFDRKSSLAYLSQKKIDELGNGIEQRKAIMIRRLGERGFSLDSDIYSSVEKEEKEFFGTQRVTAADLKKRKNEILLTNQKEDDLYFDSLCTFLITFSFEKKDYDIASSLLKDVKDLAKKKDYAKKLIDIYIKSKSYYWAHQIAAEFSGETKRQFNETINEQEDLDNLHSGKRFRSVSPTTRVK